MNLQSFHHKFVVRNMAMSLTSTFGQNQRKLTQKMIRTSTCQSTQKRSMTSTSTEEENRAEEMPKSKYGTLIGQSVIAIGIVGVLWMTRLRNPIWKRYLGETEYNLQLAENEALKPINEKWGDVKSASDTMATRLKSMEQYSGIALSNTTDPLIQQRADRIRVEGYTNGVYVALKKAEFWGVTGEMDSFEKTLDLVDHYISEGGKVDYSELKRIKSIGYSKKCSLLLADAETKANQGDVSGCSGAVQRIHQIMAKCGTEVNCGVEQGELTAVLHRANVHHVSHMFDEAKKVRKSGSRMHAKQLLEQAKSYALANQIPFDDLKAQAILE